MDEEDCSIFISHAAVDQEMMQARTFHQMANTLRFNLGVPGTRRCGFAIAMLRTPFS
jgi:hypothetical protein